MRADQSMPIPARVFVSFILLVFFGVGIWMTGMVGREFSQTLATYVFWTPCQAEMMACEVRQETRDYSAAVRYGYEFEGRRYTSQQFSSGAVRFSDLGELSRFRLAHAPGTRVACWVNPREPSVALIYRKSLASGFLVLFPLLFVAVGGFGLYGVWSGIASKKGPLSQRAAKSVPAQVRLARIFGAVFFCIGAGVTYAMFALPVWHVIQAKNWRATPCEIISSRVLSHAGSKGGSTYSVDIRYAYRIDGADYEANRFGFMGGSSAGADAKTAIVRAYRPGSRMTCFVDPSEPSRAVLERGFVASMWVGLIPLIFCAVGLSVFLLAGRGAGRLPGGLAVRGANPRGLRAKRDLMQATPLALVSGTGAMAQFVGALVGAAVWCGVVSVLVTTALRTWRSGHPDYFLSVFMLPFVAVGFFLLAMVARSFLGLRNPSFRVRATPGEVDLGSPLEIEWEQSGGSVNGLRDFRVLLEAREEVIYGNGKHRRTKKEIFFVQTLAGETDAMSVVCGGKMRVQIPTELMHSFAGGTHKIIWCVRLRGSASYRPKFDYEYVLSVLPHAPTS